MDDLLIVMSNPLDERHGAFNDWYSHIHIRDVMRLPGSSAVQRLRLTAEQISDGPGIVADRSFAYLAVYECADIERLSAGHAAVFSPMMLISDSFDFTMREAYYRPLVHRQRLGVRLHDGDYVVERLPVRFGDDMADWYERNRLPVLMALPGVVSGTLCKVADHQMLQPHADSIYLGLYRIQDRAAALAGWGAAPACPGDHTALVSCYAPLMPRLTAREVVHASPAARQAEAKARMALGDRVYSGFPEGLSV